MSDVLASFISMMLESLRGEQMEEINRRKENIDQTTMKIPVDSDGKKESRAIVISSGPFLSPLFKSQLKKD